jgi:hypothetical protein
MKRLPLLLALVFVLACVLAAPASARPRTFVVAPSGGDDTAAIQQAFNAAVAAGPGSAVRLTAGRFYTRVRPPVSLSAPARFALRCRRPRR